MKMQNKMSKQLVLVYQTDEWHSHDSKVLVAVCTSKKNSIKTIKKYINDEYNGRLDADDIYNLNQLNQTQSSSENPYPFKGEFVIEEIEQNKIII